MKERVWNSDKVTLIGNRKTLRKTSHSATLHTEANLKHSIIKKFRNYSEILDVNLKEMWSYLFAGLNRYFEICP